MTLAKKRDLPRMEEGRIFLGMMFLRSRWLMMLLVLLAPGSLRAEAWSAGRATLVSQGHGVAHWRQECRSGGRRATVDFLLLDPKLTRLGVVEVREGEPVAEGLRRSGALAGVNGGYFHPDRRPLGLVVMEGKELHGLERSKLLSGVVEVTRDRARLLRRGEFRKSARLREALQAGPFLVDQGKVVQGLNARKVAARTVLISDAKGIVALAMVSPLTLAETGRLLATPGLFTQLPPIVRALNLDGGSSTALWVADRPPLKGASHSEWKRVINALGVFPRE